MSDLAHRVVHAGTSRNDARNRFEPEAATSWKPAQSSMDAASAHACTSRCARRGGSRLNAARPRRSSPPVGGDRIARGCRRPETTTAAPWRRMYMSVPCSPAVTISSPCSTVTGFSTEPSLRRRALGQLAEQQVRAHGLVAEILGDLLLQAGVELVEDAVVGERGLVAEVTLVRRMIFGADADAQPIVRSSIGKHAIHFARDSSAAPCRSG